MWVNPWTSLATNKAVHSYIRSGQCLPCCFVQHWGTLTNPWSLSAALLHLNPAALAKELCWEGEVPSHLAFLRVVL